MTIRRTVEFEDGLHALRDRAARLRILARIDRLAAGNPGDAKPVGEGVSGLRLTFGPGYRLYFTRRGSEVVILLCGGDKASQPRDIILAKALAAGLEDRRWRRRPFPTTRRLISKRPRTRRSISASSWRTATCRASATPSA